MSPCMQPHTTTILHIFLVNNVAGLFMPALADKSIIKVRCPGLVRHAEPAWVPDNLATEIKEADAGKVCSLC